MRRGALPDRFPAAERESLEIVLPGTKREDDQASMGQSDPVFSPGIDEWIVEVGVSAGRSWY